MSDVSSHDPRAEAEAALMEAVERDYMGDGTIVTWDRYCADIRKAARAWVILEVAAAFTADDPRAYINTRLAELRKLQEDA